jgi:hypothetical protein
MSRKVKGTPDKGEMEEERVASRSCLALPRRPSRNWSAPPREPAVAQPSIRELSQELFEGLFSSSASGLSSFIIDR